MKRVWVILTMLLTCFSCRDSDEQLVTEEYWHGVVRELRYAPDGEDFVINNGDRRFNRSLYGGNTAFRVEAGDLPEFALYLPGMGGNLQFVLSSGNQFLPLNQAESIEARYRPGSMHYKIMDPILESAIVHLSVIPTYEVEGAILRVRVEGAKDRLKLQWIFGGATGKKFKRDGDIGADPESVFYLTSEKCLTNEIRIEGNGKATIFYGEGNILSEDERYENDVTKADEIERSTPVKKSISSIFPSQAALKIGDAEFISEPEKLLNEPSGKAPVLISEMSGTDEFFIGLFPHIDIDIKYEDLNSLYLEAEAGRLQLASRIKLKTPDPYLNTLGGALAVAADAVWEYPSFLHGAVAWRMPLVGWRGAYIGDWLGWHDRARTHFSAYAASQYKSPESAPAAPDPNRNLARQIEKKGYSIFTEGYLSRRPGKENSPHHYDMNLVYIDQLIRHFDWNGDLDYLKEMWPVIMRHMDWEKRNFDPDDDGLYNAYACIWASDALEYNGGGVAHSSAYNYHSNKRVAELAKLIGEDPSGFEKEANKIKRALESELWLHEKGTFSEYKDNLGLQRPHEQAGLWTIYHLMDSEVPDAFQAYQMVNYIQTELPHIPIRAIGLEQDGLYTLSTTNWLPYTWSVNNVALAEVQHTALSMWQAGASAEAFQLWKSSLVESMYLGACPGNFQQLSFYDAMRGELYRDFSDPVAMTARSLVEGLFGFKPKLLEDKVVISPGFPKAWDSASLETPDFTIDFKQEEIKQTYTINHRLETSQLVLKVPAIRERLLSVKVNGVKTEWQVDHSVGAPIISIKTLFGGNTEIELVWEGETLFDSQESIQAFVGSTPNLDFGKAERGEFHDPQSIFDKDQILEGKGNKMFFTSLSQGDFEWWEPVSVNIVSPINIELIEDSEKGNYQVSIENRFVNAISEITINGISMDLEEDFIQGSIPVSADLLHCGSNKIGVHFKDGSTIQDNIIDWDIINSSESRMVDLSSSFNDRVTSIFRNEYLTPRSPYPTLQLPKQGLGDWCSYAAYMDIDDSGLRALAGEGQTVSIGRNISFATPEDSVSNIVFTSLWDNYPDSVSIPLTGRSSHAYFLMAGTTNPMQSRFENGQIEVIYKDGSSDLLSLLNPETWYPIEQDYYQDGYAFDTGVPKPIRVHLKTGWIGRAFSEYVSIDHFTNYAIDGGAATVLDLPLDPNKELRSLKLKTTANEVVVGLMAVSLMP